MSIFEDYLESAVSDRPHSNIDRFILEDKMDKDPLSGLVQKPQYSMSVPRTPHPEDALPMGMAIGAIKKVHDINKVKSYLKYIKSKPLFKRGKEPAIRGGWGPRGRSMYDYTTKYSKKKEPEHGDWDLLGRQEGGPAERPPLLAYMQPGGLVEHIKGLSAIPPLIYDALKSASTGYTSYSKAKPLVENATQFLTDWYSHPETIKNLQKNLSQEEIDDIQSRTQKLQEARFRPSVPFIESGFKNIFSMLSGGNELLPEPSESKSGRTIRHGSPTMMPSGARGMHSTIFGDISLSPLQSPSSYGSTAIHEGEHFINPYAKKEIESLKGPFPRIGPKVHGIGTRYPDERAYIRSPNEIRARIMELRNVLDIKPGEKVSKDKLKTFNEIITPKKGREIRAEEMFYYDRLKRDYEKKTGNPRGEIVPYLDLKIRGKYDDDDILWFLNNLAMETEEEDSGVLMAQQGGHAPPLAYMQPGGPVEYAVQDETANSQMDRLMFENELEQQPQYSMGTQQEVYDPAQSWGEGMMPIGGALRLLKGSKHWPDLLKVMAQTSLRNKRKMEVLDEARSIFGKKMDAGGADEATRQYLESKWMEKVIQ